MREPPAGERSPALVYGGLALEGYDPVAYFTLGEARPGEPGIERRHDGITYRFLSEAHRAAFDAAPERYLPAYGGYCAIAMAWNRLADVDPRQWAIVDGQLYLNNSAFAHAWWSVGRARHIRTANGNWTAWRAAAATPAP